MAYTSVTRTRDGRAAIRYAFEEASHREGMDRVLASSGSNLDPNFAMQQMRDVWKAYGKDKGDYVQMYRIIQSFGLDELDPNNPEDVEMANRIGFEFAQEMYPDRQALIVTQADGKGGKLHNHVLVNSVSFVDGRSLRGKNTGFVAIAEGTNEVMRRHGFNPAPIPNGTKDKTTIAERKLAEQGEYVWKDDLKERIRQGMAHESVTGYDEYVKHMADVHGVNVRFRGNAKGVDGQKIKGISYDFTDKDGKKRTIRASRLGTDYQSDMLDKHIEQNIEKQKQSTQEKQGVVDVGFDFEAELEKMFKPKRSRPKTTRSSVGDEIQERIEARRLQRQIDEAHQNALIENAHIDALRENVQFDEQRAEEQRRREEKERQEAEAKRLAELQAKKEREEREEQEREKERLREMLSKIMPKEKHHLLQDDSFLDTYKEEFLKTDTQAKPMERVVQAVLNAEKPPEQRRYDHEKKSIQVVEQVNDELQQQDEHELEL